MRELFSQGWQFLGEQGWGNVTVPHTPKIEKVDVGMHFQGKSYYRKNFNIPAEYIGKRLVIEFEAVMQYCEISFNGAPALKHYGGYLPIYVDITDTAKSGENFIEVMADNSDNPDIPPGKPLDDLDFCYFGGIYRNVWLHVTDKLFITLPVQKGDVAGGGAFVTYPLVSEQKAKVNVKVNIENLHAMDKCAFVKTSIYYKDQLVASANSEKTVKSNQDAYFTFDFDVENPALWSVDEPNLYTLKIELTDGENALEVYEKKIGIRSVKVENGAFYLNGKPVKIYGTNRHQAFPYVGNAVSDEAHRRDACLLKEMGINFIRLCHYPQSEKILEDFDELGMLLVEPIPGWQWYSDTEQFRRLVKENAREMIRRDRNHPSIVFWESSLNETHSISNEFSKEVVDAIKEEYPTDQCLVSGDTIHKDAQFIGLDISHPCPVDEVTYKEDKGYKHTWNGVQFRREYGDWNYGGNHSSARRSREDGAMGMLLASWDQWFDYNAAINMDEFIGMASWVGIDYNRGYCPEFPICKCGALDTYRRKKFQFEMMRSQGKKPMVFIANYWDDEATSSKILVFSNCDEVELSVNGKHFAKNKPVSGEFEPYRIKGLQSNPYYWIDGTEARELNYEGLDEKSSRVLIDKFDAGKLYMEDLMWNGKNAQNVFHPYFLFRGVPYEKGYVEAVGYISGVEVARHKVCSYEQPDHIEIIPDDKYGLLRANDNDFIFVEARIVDKNGTLVVNNEGEVELTAENGSVIGEKKLNAIAGIATFMVKATDDLILTAKSGKMTATATIKTVK